ncbi:glucoamylase family protein [Pseudorhodoferax sp.]|uniref:glucoamylase family protein n=1 Tax=Pseudorhodoferax sp. TaxID=1993553 RepID=UPI002DD66D13|nr:glucoamylase family protein [Pseudorhodoferax sp.]
MNTTTASSAPALAQASRRQFCLAALAAAAGPAFAQTPVAAAAAAVAAPVSAPAGAFPFDELQRRTFNYFWETAHPVTGLVPDRYPTPSFASIAAAGFGLTAYGIGAERGYVSRAQAAERTLKTLLFLLNAPQGDGAEGTAGYRGFFYRYLHMATGRRYENIELSSVDTALLMAGVLFSGEYFDRDLPVEREIRATSRALYERVDWQWMQPRSAAIAHGWLPDVRKAPADLLVSGSDHSATANSRHAGFLSLDWVGYNEAMLLYILALGSPTYPARGDAFGAWTQGYDAYWGVVEGQTHLSFGPLFGHQYTQVWIDLRGIQDAYMRGKGMDYFENSRRATYAHRAYAERNPMHWTGYGATMWGLAACNGPADVVRPFKGSSRQFRTYDARGVGLGGSVDDGTIAPTAAAASLPFAPEIVLPTLAEMVTKYGQYLIGGYGFFDAFNQSVPADVTLTHGSYKPGFGWVDTDYLGIDQGPIVAMFENYRSGLVWERMRGNAVVRQGLERAGFQGGWLTTDTAKAKP